MRVVAVLPAYPPKSRVGAFLATHDLLAGLADRGHTVAVCQRLNHVAVYEHEGVAVYPGKSTLQLETVLRDADVVISHLGDYRADRGVTPRLARRFGAKFVRIVHGHDPARYSRLNGSDLVIFNSHHLALESRWTGPQVVVHPPLRDMLIRKPGSRITLVNLSQEKGGELFLRLAKKLPDLRFMGVKGGWGLQLTDLRGVRIARNIDIVGPTPHMTDVYASTRILLMPSERESWGMCALEAARCGIPTIAHPTPGILESMGDAAVYAHRDREWEWLEAIEHLQSPAAWQTASAKAIARVAAYDSQAELDRFADAIEEVHRGVEEDGKSLEVRPSSEAGDRESRQESHQEKVA